MRPTKLICSVEMGQFEAKDGCLHLVEATVDPDLVVVVPNPGAMVAQNGDLGRQLVVVGHDSAGLTKGTQVLRVVKAEGSNVSDGSRRPSVTASPMSLGSVLDHSQAVPPGSGHYALHVSHQSVQVDGHDCLGSGCYGSP